MSKTDPVETASDGTRDLYDVSTWEPRTALDRLAARIHRFGIAAGRIVLVLLAVVVLLVQVVLGGLGATLVSDPYAIGLVALSVVPALGLAAYIYTADVTSGEPLEMLVGTYVLGVLFAGFAAVVNTLLSFVQILPILGTVVFFYVVVGPVEEAVKLLAVRLYAYRDDRFDAVVDGAVYGAAAGLGFATIENALYITRQLNAAGAGGEAAALLGVGGGVAWLAQFGGLQQLVAQGGQITTVRALAGPGHVIYSAFAGYYLGLAKFNREDAGPIVVKGLVIAAFIHGTYNVLAGVVPGVVALAFPGVPVILLFFGFVVVYDGLFGYLLYRKLARYRRVYRATRPDGTEAETEREFEVARTEFEE
ncbi:PrsW family intramembrane metalloprotease [Halosegnis marinus]|uniref:PrsW family intramembrane metalloprotease n=1 Tax=Halosegnis marinus TaxID=3034023 RepID=A0ABD5ZM91_9EURY|nr:PrsW family intramembrane metalloprotease [Halosegnis sp. DT85]